MEGGQKTPINLEAGLNINTSDMLVPFSQQTFQHNWQKYQGKFLSNSVRFEKNGWAAGWNVINFEYDTSRTKLADNVYLGSKKINDYVYLLSIYDSEKAFNSLQDYYVIRDSRIVDGNATLVDNNTITGKVNDKEYTLTWDQVTRQITCDNPDIDVTVEVQSNRSTVIKVKDTTASFELDFDLYTAEKLTGDAIKEIKYSNFDGTAHSWHNYAYDVSNNVVTTPEGNTLTPTVVDNQIQFDYTADITDETINIAWTLEKFYPRFNNLYGQDMTNKEKMLLSSDASEQLAFNRYRIKISPTDLLSRDTNGVVVNVQIPLWATIAAGVSGTLPLAKKCDNCRNKEVNIHVGTGVNTRVKYINAYDLSETEEDLVDNLDVKTIRNAIQTITGLPYRFNQIFVYNTIEPVVTWSEHKNTINKEAWISTSKQFKNMRLKDINAMTKLLGSVYTWGTITADMTEFFDYNDVFKWDEADNCVYSKQDIDNICSFKVVGDADDPDNVTPDETFITDNVLPTADLMERFIAKFTGTVSEYSTTQAAKTYDELYTNGVYTYNTHETVGIDDTEIGFWPFEKVPRYNLLMGDGTVVEGVYWTDGTDVITNIDLFKEKVLGEKDAGMADKDNFIVKNARYSRKRIVKCYKPFFDFNYVYEENYSSIVDYQNAVNAFNATWNDYYPEVISPLDSFDSTKGIEDATYTNYTEIEIVKDATVSSYWVEPGQYVNNNFAVEYGNNKKVILFENGSYTVHTSVYHQNKDCTDKYVIKERHVPGSLSGISITDINLPFYFGKNTTIQLIKSDVSSGRYYTPDTMPASTSSAYINAYVNYEEEYISNTDWGYLPISNPDPACWFHHAFVYYYGGTCYATCVLAGDVEAVLTQSRPLANFKNYYATGDLNQGLKLSCPIWGNSATRITYPEMKKATTINDANAFIIEKVDSADIPSDWVYFDRDDLDKGVLLFNIAENSREPDKSDGTGSFSLKFESVTPNSLSYAKKQRDDAGNEITYANYIPGIAFGDVMSEDGHLQVINNYPVPQIMWTPVIIKFPMTGALSFSNKNTFGSEHVFYTDKYNSLNSATITLGEIDSDTMLLPFVIKFNDNELNCVFTGLLQSTTSIETDVVLQSDSTYTVKETAVLGLAENAQIALDLALNFENNKTRFYKTTDPDYLLQSCSDGIVTINNNGLIVKYDPTMQDVLSPKAQNITVDNLPNMQHIKAVCETFEKLTTYLQAVYDGTITGDIVSFVFRGIEYTFDMTTLDTNENYVTVVSTDIRHPEKTNVIGKLIPDGEYQLLRQQWNTTTEVQNFWWIDAKHILELNQYDFVLKRNTEELDDWNGNRFESIYKVSRSNILSSDINRWFVPNVYNIERPALFVTVKEQDGNILFRFYDTRKEMAFINSVSIPLVQHKINEVLNDNNKVLNTYNPLTVGQLISKAEWTSTMVDSYILIGCHFSCNYDQWTIMINLDNFTVEKVIQGYGFVGVHGDLTGGQLPNDYVDVNRGFNDRVQDFEALGISEIDTDNVDKDFSIVDPVLFNVVDKKVVGTTKQQWYIQKELYGIVSHLTYADGTFTKQLLPITNNYAAIYKSPSISTAILGDMMVQFAPFANVFKFQEGMDTIWQLFMGFLGYPLLYYFAPRFSSFAYLQQTLGQYAYVHYNSSRSLPEEEPKDNPVGNGMETKPKDQTDPVLSSSFTFDKQVVNQNVSSKMEYFEAGIMGILLTAFSESLQVLDRKVAINEDQNQTAVSDAGKKFLDNVLENVGAMGAASIITQSKTDLGISSSVTGIKSIDMFYSTSDTQRVLAGPGFVEHQMVADCVAQSVTDVQTEGKATQLFLCIRSLTTMQLKITTELELMAADALDKVADATAAQMVCGTSLGAVAVGIHAAAVAVRAAVKAQEIAGKEVDKLLDMICARGITSTVAGAVSRHALTVEGKHKYGEKNEVFMWPCWGTQSGQLKYTDEKVKCGVKNIPWMLTLHSIKYWRAGMFNALSPILSSEVPSTSSNQFNDNAALNNVGTMLTWGSAEGENDMGKPGDCVRGYWHYGRMAYYQAACFGESIERTLPDDMTKIEGVKSFLPKQSFRNENIGVSDPAFAPSLIHDYIVDKNWDLSQCCTYGLQQWVTVKDTKITNCPPSNIVITGTFCGVATPYTAIEARRGIEKAFMRPCAITPNTLAFNCTGYNTILEDKLYHAFDGISQRIVDFVGAPGLNKNRQSFIYSIQVNDRFKRSNIIPANEAQGNFEADPIFATDTIDKLWNLVTVAAKEKGLGAGTIGEDKDAVRWAIPLFTEPVSTLPACVKTMAASTLAVVEGVTSLVTAQVTDTNAAYKASPSVDFTIGKNVFRTTEEYICTVTPAEAGNVITELIPTLGLKFIGSTPTEAFFYSKATRCYYSFTGSSLTKIDMMERFRDIQKGYWDFVNQEVVMPCLMTFKRLNAEVEDKDTETDNIIIPVLSKGQVSGELPPPITTIFNDRSWYKCVSLPSGFAYQGPNRVIINRSVFVEYMERSMKDNFGKWERMSKEKYNTRRVYPEEYSTVDKDVTGVDGWTHNPFLLVTSALGSSEDTDCIFEWTITFCWPIEMDLLYGVDNYAVVNITAETMTPGGKVKSRPTHVYLTKELFTRNGNYGYYSFKYQSKNGAGNRERLHIWSDQYVAISLVDCEAKTVTTRRTEQLTQQVDVQKLKEL